MSAAGPLTLIGLTGIPEVPPGSDLAALLGTALAAQALTPRASDVLVVAQKVVSKAEGRLVDLASVVPGARASDLAAVTVATLVNHRGAADRAGRRLEVTEVATGDALAAAAGLIMGEAAEGTPAVLIRGFEGPSQASPARTLIRPLEEDLFR